MRTTFALLLLISPPTTYADVKIVGPSNVPSHKLVKLTADGADPKAGLVWRVYPRLDDRASSPKGKLEFVAPPGVYEVELLAIKLSADGETLIEETRHTVTIGTPPVPPVPPGPDPKPPVPPTPVPEPTDPFWPTLKTVWAAESSPTKNADKATLWACYVDAGKAVIASKATTTDAMFLNDVRPVFKRAMPSDDALRGLRTALQKELDEQIPPVVGTPLTGEKRAAYRGQFERFTKLLEALK